MGNEEVRIMPNITYLNRKTGMGYEQLMKLQYPIFLALLRENYILDLKETPEGRAYLEQIERLKVTTPDFSKLSQISGYQKAGGN
ncbi:hypothetical protein ACSU64_05530 [Bacillaceae bacterium C204]|uniref:hypothetical protein n=1 Tax=Neobacillus sp. 204 TaxID=3383351 RepID=UPI00397D66CD